MNFKATPFQDGDGQADWLSVNGWVPTPSFTLGGKAGCLSIDVHAHQKGLYWLGFITLGPATLADPIIIEDLPSLLELVARMGPGLTALRPPDNTEVNDHAPAAAAG